MLKTVTSSVRLSWMLVAVLLAISLTIIFPHFAALIWKKKRTGRSFCISLKNWKESWICPIFPCLAWFAGYRFGCHDLLIITIWLKQSEDLPVAYDCLPVRKLVFHSYTHDHFMCKFPSSSRIMISRLWLTCQTYRLPPHLGIMGKSCFKKPVCSAVKRFCCFVLFVCLFGCVGVSG